MVSEIFGSDSYGYSDGTGNYKLRSVCKNVHRIESNKNMDGSGRIALIVERIICERRLCDVACR
jgi:hypothetical protein